MSEIMSDEQNYKMDVISRKNINDFDNDLFKENMTPCSKKMKLFDMMEKQFLSTGSINILKNQTNEIKPPYITLHKESKKTTESTKNPILVVIEKNDDKSAVEKKDNENDKEVPTSCEISQTEIKKDNLDDNTKLKECTGNRDIKIETKNKNEEKKLEIVSDCKDFENILDQNMQDQDIGTSDVESDEDKKQKQTTDVKSDQDEKEKQRIDVKSDQDENKLRKQLNFEDKEISRGKENVNDNNLDKAESKLDEDEKPKNAEEEEDKSDSNSESEEDTMRTPLSFQEQRRLNKMKLAGQMSNLLDSARLTFKNISERLDKEKLKKEMISNPRKRKRCVVVDQSTRELIKEITPVRRSSRQVERKYYTEGVTDPELMKLLTKLEKYMRLNGKFKLSQDESCYEQDFLGFKQDESRRALYPEDYNPKRRRYRRIAHASRSVPVPAMDPSEITDTILSKVATHVSAKVYSQTGSTCHQCRQKTLDTKTFCRSGVCTGVRGQFCGVCLLNRYGEDIVKTLLDEKWACPPCRNICNCSICRNRKGLPPTGILTPLALGKGFDSVKDYLKEAEKDLEFEEY